MEFPSIEDYQNAYNECCGAAWLGDLDRLKELAVKEARGRDLGKTIASYKGENGLSIFHSAAISGRKRIVKYLVEELKLNVDDFIDDRGFTPLHVAIGGDHYDLAVYLLDNGANPNAADNCAITPLHMLAQMGPLKLLEYLIDKGAEIDAKSLHAGTPLQVAASENRKDVMKVLLDNLANPNVAFDDLCSPLYSSVVKGSIECVKLLLQAGADPNFVSLGETPLGIAAARGETEIIKCLLNAGADPNVPNLDGKTPIEVAASLDKREAFECLLPVTSPFITDWSFDGILNFVDSKDAQNKGFWPSKSKGDEAFKRKDYVEAIHCYTEALSYLPPNANLICQQAAIYSNRSLCWARLKKGDSALEDALSCQKLWPDLPKAHYRVGGAWMVLKNYMKAADNYYKGWKLDPKNRELELAFLHAIEAQRRRST